MTNLVDQPSFLHNVCKLGWLMPPPEQSFASDNVIIVERKNGLKNQKKFVATKSIAEVPFETAALPLRLLRSGVVELNDAAVSTLSFVKRLVGTF